MIRIAYIALKGMPIGGGIEKLTEEIGSRMVDRGHEVVVYSSRDYGTVDGVYRGMHVKTIPSLNFKSFHKLSISFFAMLDSIRGNKFDLIHIHAVGPSIFSFISRLRGIPTVVQTHGLEWKRDKWGPIAKAFFKFADYSAIYFPHATTSVSKVQKKYYENKFGRMIHYIPTGVNRVTKRDPQWILEKGIEPNQYILFAARLVEEKGAHFLIDAFRKLNTNFKLVIAGDAAHAEKYKASLMNAAADDSRILFPGFVSGAKLEELFSNSYLFCLPSTIEGLPIALLEAMSYGSCCVASDIPENKEAIGRFGYTFKSRDSDNLRRVLSDLIDHPEKVDLMKEPARAHVLRNYSWDTVSEQIEGLYTQLLSQKRRSE
jgi:glycosyltransferase involved in cell wall biosynthesis